MAGQGTPPKVMRLRPSIEKHRWSTEQRRSAKKDEVCSIHGGQYWEKKMDEMRSHLNDALATQAALTKQLMRMVSDKPDDNSALFPLESVEDLVKMEHKITPDSKEFYIKRMNTLLTQAAITKTIRKVFSDDLLESHNVDGKNGKLSLRAYPQVLSCLLEAIQMSEGGQPAEKVLRNAIGCDAKNTVNKMKNRQVPPTNGRHSTQLSMERPLTRMQRRSVDQRSTFKENVDGTSSDTNAKKTCDVPSKFRGNFFANVPQNIYEKPPPDIPSTLSLSCPDCPYC
ncbi:uncharacterized protein LOC124460647 [Drosophila willistoni]|uniref:uncharacterized protein LOC124460647 n=1 Tax=Drosophila willistoni TaxID=7260 RepID=UPI001F07E17E|nr:uncharacterized protein LOC124460647 [Drosophila willistoni]